MRARGELTKPLAEDIYRFKIGITWYKPMYFRLQVGAEYV